MKTRFGETKENKYGSKMTIVEYKNASEITVEFENGYITNTSYNHFKNGGVQNVYDKSVFKIGFIGEGTYKTKINNSDTIQYNYWHSMLRRCYSKIALKKVKAYEDKYVCKEWLNFQTFAKWFDENYYKIDDETMQLDKDILCKNNKVYSPYTCVFVPQRINLLFTKRQNDRGEYPIGISKDKRNNFIARCNTGINGKRNHLGTFNTPEDAFYKGYKPFKEDYIKEIAELYKLQIPIDLYEAMYRYIVEIDD